MNVILMVRIKTYISWCEILQTYWLIKIFKVTRKKNLNFRTPIFYHIFCAVNAVSLLLLKGSQIIPSLFKSTCMTYLYIFFRFKISSSILPVTDGFVLWINGMLQNENNIALSLIWCFKKQLTPRYIYFQNNDHFIVVSLWVLYNENLAF